MQRYIAVAFLLMSLVARGGQMQSVRAEEPAADRAQDEGRAAEALELTRDVARSLQFYGGGERSTKLAFVELPLQRYSNPIAGEFYAHLFIWTNKGRPEAAASIQKWYKPRSSDDRQQLILGEPVLRFNDQVSGVIDAVQLIWCDDGRPEATASFWHRKDGLIAHEFHSLSENRVLAKLDDKTVWHPSTPGVQPKSLDGFPEPAKTAPGRLSQMRTAARQFTASVVNQAGNRPLRLLSQPVSRHGTANTSVLDAAWFVFAKGTNPEVMLLIEARRGQADTYAWYCSPVRMTSAECELKRDDLVVWHVPRDAGESPDETYFNNYARE